MSGTSVSTLGSEVGEGNIPLDISSPLHDSNVMTLLAELEAKVKHYQERVEQYKAKLRVWESALRAAREEVNVNRRPEAKQQQRIEPKKGVANRAFVREVLKAYAGEGVTPKRLRQLAEERQLSIPRNFPYAILYKFKTQTEEVRDEGGRYFPIKKASN